MAGKADKKDKANAKSKGGKGKSGKPTVKDGIEAVSVASHPRASAYVRRAKGWGGLVGFGLAAILSAQAKVPLAQTLERALLFGIVGYLVGWALSVVVARQLVIAEMRAIHAALAPPPAEEPPPNKPKPAATRERKTPASSGGGR